MLSGFTYFELKDDGVYVHTTKKVGNTVLGEDVYCLSYRKFNRLLQEEAGEVEQVLGLSILDSYMRTSAGRIQYTLPTGTFWIAQHGNVLRVKQRIGSTNFPFFQSEMYDNEEYRADFGSTYVVEWEVSGNIHTGGVHAIQPINIEKVVSEQVNRENMETVPVPYLKEKLLREWRALSVPMRIKTWKIGAELMLRKVNRTDMGNATFAHAFEASKRNKTPMNWEGVTVTNG
ncbi:hypothetical protein B4086_5527 [Bacillus cereus]|nr:hypothetical protein B4086_5527 [Bacillus cereus]